MSYERKNCEVYVLLLKDRKYDSDGNMDSSVLTVAKHVIPNEGKPMHLLRTGKGARGWEEVDEDELMEVLKPAVETKKNFDKIMAEKE